LFFKLDLLKDLKLKIGADKPKLKRLNKKKAFSNIGLDKITEQFYESEINNKYKIELESFFDDTNIDDIDNITGLSYLNFNKKLNEENSLYTFGQKASIKYSLPNNNITNYLKEQVTVVRPHSKTSPIGFYAKPDPNSRSEKSVKDYGSGSSTTITTVNTDKSINSSKAPKNPFGLKTSSKSENLNRKSSKSVFSKFVEPPKRKTQESYTSYYRKNNCNNNLDDVESLISAIRKASVPELERGESDNRNVMAMTNTQEVSDFYEYTLDCLNNIKTISPVPEDKMKKLYVEYKLDKTKCKAIY